MADSDALFRLAASCGVELSYHDIFGNLRTASQAALEGVLSSLMGEPVTARDAERWLARLAEQEATRTLAPVTVAWDGRAVLTLGELPAGFVIEVSVELEQGGELTDECAVNDLRRVEGAPRRLRYELPHELPMGYHRVVVRAGSLEVAGALWSAPRRAFAGDDHPSWGVFAPTYALRSERNAGVGDLADLEQLADWVGRRGGSMVATLPLLPVFLDKPYDPSPYAPVSRLFWNELFLALERLPELEMCPEAAALMQSTEFAATSRSLRALPLVDYQRTMLHKRRILSLLAQAAFDSTRVRGEIEQALGAHPALGDYARFRAASEMKARPWRQWASGARAGKLEPKDYDPSGFAYHAYVQLRMADQVAQLQGAAGEAGVGLYLDLSLGAHPDGYDAWRFQKSMLDGCAAGAPPDTLFEGGQNWGFAPPHPVRTRETEHRYFRRSLAHAMQSSDVLRLDHVMGLHRMYCVPTGLPPTEGVYVRQPADELYAAVCIESHRNQTYVVGEDLGTVPDAVRESMRRHGMASLHVVQYDVPHPDAVDPEETVASLNTHDMPTYAGFLHGRDIDERVELGLSDDERANIDRAARDALREEKLRALRERGLLEADDDAALLDAELAVLATSSARRVLVTLEDLWLERLPQNVPGTGAERPNWRRKFALSLEEMQAAPEVLRRLSRLGERGTRSPSRPPKARHVQQASLLTDMDVHLFNEGTHYELWKKLGAHAGEHQGQRGCHFAVWAPNAQRVSVIGDFNGWEGDVANLSPHGSSGIWEGFIEGVGQGALYKYRIVSRDGRSTDKADPMAQRAEVPPRTASMVHSHRYAWGDDAWMESRAGRNRHDAPCSIYEVHLGSFRRHGDGRMMGYREITPWLVDHVRSMGFTHVELLPVLEHPFYGSWGYQSTGFFAATSRYGPPEDLMYLIDQLHQAGIGVILDWVPGHFPEDDWALGRFDGTCLYEHEDPRQGFHPDWKSLIFNYSRHEVQSFLISSALYWLECFHVDGLRVDGVASMLYLDYSRAEGEWVPNEYGGRENLPAIALLRRLNEVVYERHPDVQTTAEESTSWPMVSRPTHLGGLGFGFKWDMGWMHDTLQYFQRDPVHRRYHQHELTFRTVYAWHENFVLPLSHDEVVHGKRSLLDKMPGDDWQRFANLRALYAFMFASPGHKLLFMGSEIGQWKEWNHEASLEWDLLQGPLHQGLAALLRELNQTYRAQPALYAWDMRPDGFAWVDTHNAEQSVLAFERRTDHARPVLVVMNLTPVPREGYRVGVERAGYWQELVNTDAEHFGGSGVGNLGGAEAEPVPAHGRPHSLRLTLPPLAVVYLLGPE